MRKIAKYCMGMRIKSIRSNWRMEDSKRLSSTHRYKRLKWRMNICIGSWGRWSNISKASLKKMIINNARNKLIFWLNISRNRKNQLNLLLINWKKKMSNLRNIGIGLKLSRKGKRNYKEDIPEILLLSKKSLTNSKKNKSRKVFMHQMSTKKKLLKIRRVISV
jgi:hypothetical protein